MFVFVILIFTSCQTQKNASVPHEMTIEGNWVVMNDAYGIDELKSGIHWQLAGIGLTGSDWQVYVEPDDLANHWHVKLTFIDPDDCLGGLLNLLDGESPFAAQLSQITQNPVHVAKITRQPLYLEDWSNYFEFDSETLITASLIEDYPRVIGFNSNIEWPNQIAFYAFLQNNVHHVETIDVMTNGRLRYGQYSDGQLIFNSELGSVARCQWCHEGKLLDLQNQVDIEGYAPYSLFSEALLSQNDLIMGLHDAVHPEIMISDSVNHENGEQIFEIYLNPTVKGLSNEWNVSVQEVEAILLEIELTGYVHPEYPEWGTVYSREDLNNALGVPGFMPMTPREWPLSDWPDVFPGIDCY